MFLTHVNILCSTSHLPLNVIVKAMAILFIVCIFLTKIYIKLFLFTVIIYFAKKKESWCITKSEYFIINVLSHCNKVDKNQNNCVPYYLLLL